MTDCELCNKPLADAKISKVDDGKQHALCRRLWAERRDSGICTYCGKNPERHDNALHCEDCDNNDPTFKNYPGPQ